MDGYSLQTLDCWFRAGRIGSGTDVKRHPTCAGADVAEVCPGTDPPTIASHSGRCREGEYGLIDPNSLVIELGISTYSPSLQGVPTHQPRYRSGQILPD